MIFLFFFFFFFFLTKPRFSLSHHKNLKISRNTLQSQISYLTNPMLVCMWKNESNKWSLSNPIHESKTQISNDMQCSNKLNTPMTCNPQLWCKLCPINNITTNKNKNIFYIQKKQIYTNKNNKQTECLSTPPNLNDTVPQYDKKYNIVGWETEVCKGQDVPRTWTPKYLSKTNSNLFLQAQTSTG